MLQTLLLKMEVVPGAEVEKTCKDLILLARHLNIRVYAEHNDIPIYAQPDSSTIELYKKWQKDFDRR